MINKIGAIIFLLLAGYCFIINLINGKYLFTMFQYLFVGFCLVLLEAILYEKRPMNDIIACIFIWPFYVLKGVFKK